MPEETSIRELRDDAASHFINILAFNSQSKIGKKYVEANILLTVS
jgi:hypothetical protein